jgi:hypothetical protein
MGQVEVEATIRGFAAEQDLTVGPIRTLKTIPGGAHWHIRKGRGSGTLEVTLDATASELRVAVHENRRGSWAGATLESFAASLKATLKKT